MLKRILLIAAALLIAASPGLCTMDDSPHSDWSGDGGAGMHALPPGHPPIGGRDAGGAQEAPGMESPGMHMKLWNPETVREFKGRVSALGPALVKAPGRPERPVGPLMMSLETAEGPIEVVLGPAWYLYLQEPKLAEGDEVSATGSVVTYDGHSFVLAQSVTKGGQTLVLRDENGAPVWMGARYGVSRYDEGVYGPGEEGQAQPGCPSTCPPNCPGAQGQGAGGGTMQPGHERMMEERGGMMQPGAPSEEEQGRGGTEPGLPPGTPPGMGESGGHRTVPPPDGSMGHEPVPDYHGSD